MRNWLRHGTVMLVVLAWCGGASAQPPPDVGYQGKLLDAAGDPLPGPANLQIRIFDQPTDGSQLYAEDHPGIALEGGVFHLLLGTGGNPVGTFDTELFAQTNRWLEVLVNGEALAPRQPFSSVAYALQSEAAQSATFALEADQLDGLDASDFAVAGHDHAGAEITSGTVAEARVDGALARDVEILPTVLANDGPGSGLDADSVDGVSSEELLRSDTLGEFTGPQLTVASGSVVLVEGALRFGPGVRTEWEDGAQSFGFDSAEARFEASTDLAVSGTLSAEEFAFQSPKTHFVQIEGSEFGDETNLWFVSYEDGYARTAGTSTAIITRGVGVHFEGSASRITGFQCRHWDDDASKDLSYTANLLRRSTGGEIVQTISTIEVDSSGALPAVFKTTGSLGGAVLTRIDSDDTTYFISVQFTSPPSIELRFYGCRVAYEVDEP